MTSQACFLILDKAIVILIVWNSYFIFFPEPKCFILQLYFMTATLAVMMCLVKIAQAQNEECSKLEAKEYHTMHTFCSFLSRILTVYAH